MRHRVSLYLTAAALAASLPLSAQPVQSPQVTPYRSAFDDYRAFNPVEVQDWRQSNDTVRDIGGWRAYAREIQEAREGAEPNQSGKGPAGQAAPADPHQGHHK